MKLNPISRLAAHRAGELTLDDRQLKHCLVWEKLFKNGDFFDAHIQAYPDSEEGPASEYNTNVMLVGPRLKDIYEGQDLKDEPVELALVSLDWSGNTCYDDRVSGAEGLCNCLRLQHPQDYDKTKCVATIQDYNWKVNIWQWACQDDATAATNVMKFLRNGKSVYMMFSEDGGEGSSGWGVREFTSQDPLDPKGRGFRIPCAIHFHMGKMVDWTFFEWEGRRDVDGGGKATGITGMEQ